MSETTSTTPSPTETISVPLIKTSNNFLPDNFTVSFVRPELFKKTQESKTQESSSNFIYVISSSLSSCVFLICIIVILFYYKPELFSFMKNQ